MVQNNNNGTGRLTDGWTNGRTSGRRMDGREVSRLTTALTTESSHHREPKTETKKCKNLFFYDDIS
jgi:hypothetical protein